MKLTPFVISLFFLVLAYVIVPVVFYSSSDAFFFYLGEVSSPDWLFYSFSVLLLYIGWFLGYFSYKISGLGLGFRLVDNYSNGSCKVDFYIIFFIFVFFFLLFLSGYDGVFNVLENISSIRSGNYKNVNYYATFFGLASNVGLVALGICFLNIMFCASNSGRFRVFWVFLFVLVLFIFKKFMDGGRGGILGIFLYLFILYGLVTDKMISLSKLFVLFFSVFCFSVLGKEIIFNGFDPVLFGRNISDIEGKLLRDFGHPFLSVLAVYEFDLSYTRGFYDSFAFLERIGWFLGFERNSVSHYNTFVFLGQYESHIPPGFMAWSLYQGGLLYLLISSFFFGVLVSLLSALSLMLRNNNSYLCMCFLVAVILDIPRWVFGADVGIYIFSFGVYLLVFVLLILLGRVKIYFKSRV